MRILRSRRFLHALIAVVVLLGVIILYWLASTGRSAQFLNSWEYWFRDSILTGGGRRTPRDDRLVYLGIDNATRNTLSSWDVEDIPAGTRERHAVSLMIAAPQACWSREVYALLCERLLGAGARAVIFDIVFERPGDGDQAFKDVLQRFPDGIVLGMDYKNKETIGPGAEAEGWSVPSNTILPDSSTDHPRVGYVVFWPGFNGIVRTARYQVPPDDEPTPPASLDLRAGIRLGAGHPSRPFERHLFRYTGPPGTFPMIPMYQVFMPKYWEGNLGSGKTFRGKIVMVGAYGALFHDQHLTPFGVMEGPEIHLNSINALLHHEFLHELPPWTANLLIVLAAVAAWLLTVFVKKIWLRLAAFVLLATGYYFSLKLAHDRADTIVLAIPPVLAFGVAGFISFVLDFTHETLEKLRIRRTLESYVSKDVVREVLDNPESYLSKLGGERESVALIMTDLRGFTTMSESMDSTQLVAQLNEYLSVMVDDIFSRRGSVDKFIGDAILAVWGHVKSEGPAQDATLAVEAGLLMRESLRRLNADWEGRGLRSFHMGIGVNYGEVIFGNIGSSRKMEPTVIGDAVNTASRLEGLTKDYGRDLLIGEAAADLIGHSFRLQFIDKVTMKGKTKPLRIYSVVSRGNEPLEPQMADYLKAYELAQASYSTGNFKEAKALFENCLPYSPDDPLLRMYVERCTTLMDRPSDGAWTGVHVAEHK